MSICPCCSHKLLCHIGYQRTYWFCSACWQEMPDLNVLSQSNLTKSFAGFNPEKSSQTKPIKLKKATI